MTMDASRGARLRRGVRVCLSVAILAASVLGCIDREPPPLDAAGTQVESTPAVPASKATEVGAAEAGVSPTPEQLPARLIGRGLMPAIDVQADPELATNAPAPGRATARWGDSGRNVDAENPWRAIAYDGIHDRSSEAVGLLQEPRSAFRELPRSISGNYVNWAAALRGGAIRPRARVGSEGQMEVLTLEVMLLDTKTMPIVIFPHSIHTELLACQNCHEWLFKAKRGENDITMAEIARGRACGMCHGKVAFPPTECFRCHNGPRPQG